MTPGPTQVKTQRFLNIWAGHFFAVKPVNMGLYAAWGVVTGYIMLMRMAFPVRFRGGKWKTIRVIET